MLATADLVLGRKAQPIREAAERHLGTGVMKKNNVDGARPLRRCSRLRGRALPNSFTASRQVESRVRADLLLT